jgi:ribosome-associated toxin RatA of RatAB toxin-antitoxin module
MPRFEHTVEIDAEQLALFDLTQDYGRRLRWDPFLKEAYLIGADEPAVGVKAWCVAHNGIGMETIYVSYDRPTVVAVKMTRGPAILSTFAGSWRFEGVEPGKTRVTFTYFFETRPGVLAWLLNPLLHAYLSNEMHQRIAALKRAVSTAAVTTGDSQ